LDFIRFLYGVENSYLKRKLERLINISTGDITSAFNSLGSRTASGPVIISGVKGAQQAAKALGVDVTTLPV